MENQRRSPVPRQCRICATRVKGRETSIANCCAVCLRFHICFTMPVTLSAAESHLILG